MCPDASNQVRMALHNCKQLQLYIKLSYLKGPALFINVVSYLQVDLGEDPIPAIKDLQLDSSTPIPTVVDAPTQGIPTLVTVSTNVIVCC